MSDSLKRAGLNFSKLLSGRLVGAALSLIYLAIAARELGPRGFGVLVLMHSVIMFIGGTVAFSGWQTLVRYGQQAAQAGDHGEVRSLFRFTAGIEAIMAVVAIVIAAIALPIFAERGNWGPIATTYAPWYSLAILVAARQTPYGFLQLYRKFSWLGAHSALTPVLRLIGTFATIHFDLGLEGFILTWLIAAVLEGLALWGLAFLLLIKEGIGMPGFGGLRQTLADHPGIGRYAFVSNLDYTLVYMMPLALPLLVGAVLGPAAAGLFSLAARATNALQQPAQVIGQSGFEVVSDLTHQRRWRELAKMLIKGTAITMGAGLVIAAIFVSSGETVMALFGGAEFAAAGSILALVAIARALSMAQPGLAATLAALGRPGASLVINAATGIVAIPAMVVAMHHVGLDGAGYGMIGQAVAASLLSIVVVALFLRRRIAAEDAIAA